MAKKFKYVGKKRGKKMKGEIEAEGLVQARSKLRTEGIRDVKLTEIKPKKKSSFDIQITWGPSVPSPEGNRYFHQENGDDDPLRSADCRCHDPCW